MRRLLPPLLTIALLIPALAVLAIETANYKDTFDGGNYSGNYGSLVFDGPWTEFGDGGGYSSGKVHVDSSGCSGECAHIDGGVLSIASYGLQRDADLSTFESVELSFDVTVDPDPILLGLLPNTGNLQVQVYAGGWVTIETFPLKEATSESVTIDVSPYANENFKVRFGVSTLTYNGTSSIDNVELSGTIIPTTTTTTTTSTTTTTTTTIATIITIPTLPTLPGQGTTTTTTTTTQPSSSTIPGSAPTTTAVEETSENGEPGATPSTTTTTVAGTTSTSGDDGAVAVGGGIPPGSGLHQAGVGLIADYEPGMMGDMGTDEVEVLAADLTAEFSIAAETFRTARVWIAALALLMAVAVVGGMDRRRSRTESATPVV